MTQPRDGGPAFPGGHGNPYLPQGMSLRDYLAGQALPAALECAILAGKWDNELIASAVYAVADALLTERAK